MRHGAGMSRRRVCVAVVRLDVLPRVPFTRAHSACSGKAQREMPCRYKKAARQAATGAPEARLFIEGSIMVARAAWYAQRVACLGDMPV